MNKTETLFESFLWRSRYVVLLAVIASLAVSLAMFYMSTVDAYYTVVHLVEYASPGVSDEARAHLRGTTVTHIVEVIDEYVPRGVAHHLQNTQIANALLGEPLHEAVARALRSHADAAQWVLDGHVKPPSQWAT